MLMKRMGVFFSYVVVFCLLSAFSFTTGFSSGTAQASSNNEISVFLNGTKLAFDVKPYIKNGRTMVPFRKIFESLGVDISWNAASRTILAQNYTTEIFIEISKSHAYVNGYKIGLDVAAEINNGRTFVPLRFVSENTGAEVSWDGNTRSVYISYVNNKYNLVEKSYYRDLEFSVDRLDIKEGGKQIIVYGKTNLPDRVLSIEVYDDSRKFVSSLAAITGKEGDMYIFEAVIYTTSGFSPKNVLVKTFNDYKKQVKISEYMLQ